MQMKAVIRKEWKELSASKMLLLGTFLPPLILLIVSIVTIKLMGSQGMSSELKPLLNLTNPIMNMADVNDQMIMSKFYMSVFLLLPAALPLMIASNSIIGEKKSGSLESVLVTPITTKQLLLGKVYASVIPATVLTWLTQLIFWGVVILPQLSSDSPQFFSIEWTLLMFLLVPLISIISVGLGVIISSRVNDEKAAQQIALVIVLPVLAFAFGQMMFVNLMSNWMMYAGTLLVAAIAAWIVLRITVPLFDRRTIISRWR